MALPGPINLELTRDAAPANLNQTVETSYPDEISAKALFLVGWTRLQPQCYPAAVVDENSRLRTHADKLRRGN